MASEDLLAAMHKVFTPGFPITQKDLFRGRIEQLAHILQTIPSPGRHPIIFGQRGVGKTSIATIFVERFPPGGREFQTVKITCVGEDTFKSIWNRILQRATISFKENAFGFSREESEGKISLADFGPENGVTSADIALILGKLQSRAVFVIDEFDRVNDPNVRSAMADLIKNVSDNNPLVTLVIVGVGESITELIGEHPSIARNLVQIEMPLMADDDIKEIVSKGAEQLEISVESSVLGEIAQLAGGFPHYAHLLGLGIAKACLIRDTKVATQELFDNFACELSIEEAIDTYRDIFSQATRTTKPSRYPAILCACGVADHDERGIFRATDVVEAVFRLFEVNLTVQAVVPALQAFTEEDRGRVLTKVPIGSQSHYRFREPMMRPFLRIKARTLSED